MPELIPAVPGSPHVERRIRLGGNQTYCSCGRPWPCPIVRMIAPDIGQPAAAPLDLVPPDTWVLIEYDGPVEDA